MYEEKMDTLTCSNSDQNNKGRSFIKMHGLENHFAIFDARQEPFMPSKKEIIKICDSELGVGADQVIIIENSSSHADALMRIINVDGFEAEACGNATRCIAWLLMKEFNKKQVKIETLAGILSCYLLQDDWVKCDMGRISVKSENIPLSMNIDTLQPEIEIGPLKDGVITNIGNPHITFFVDQIDAIDIEKWAPVIQEDKLFPRQVNVGIAEILDNENINLKVYERGAGLTAACGTGACVAVFAAYTKGLISNKKINVLMAAGKMIIELQAEKKVTMSGPVTYLYSGLWNDTE
tara:strand:- start:761 stop:1639 length:879 start_codon:yes stop_codon:yes gene_type:complete